jgi:hypothetical protein
MTDAYHDAASAHSTFAKIIETARAHYENLKADIPNASNRIEHIRLTTLAQEAGKLLTDLEFFDIGLVYTRIQNLGPTELEKYMQLQQKAHDERIQLESGIPEFKSPFDPKLQYTDPNA